MEESWLHPDTQEQVQVAGRGRVKQVLGGVQGPGWAGGGQRSLTRNVK